MISKEEKEDNKLTMICYLGTFNWNMKELKKQTYEEVEKLYLDMNPPKGMLIEPTPLDSEVGNLLEHKLNCLDGEITTLQSYFESDEPHYKMGKAHERLETAEKEYEFLSSIKQSLSDKEELITGLIDTLGKTTNDASNYYDKLNAIEELYKSWFLEELTSKECLNKIYEILKDKTNV